MKSPGPSGKRRPKLWSLLRGLQPRGHRWRVFKETIQAQRDHAAPMGQAPERPRIFLIGFQKTATTSFYRWFTRAGIRTVHYGGVLARNNIAARMYANVSLGRDILDGINAYEAYMDLNYSAPGVYLEAGLLFEEMHRDYPDAYFILNTRPTEDWLNSRHRHQEGAFMARVAGSLGLTLQDIRESDARQHQAHHARARDYFAKAADARFLDYDISTDTPEKAVAFLSADYKLDPDDFPQANRTRS